MIDKEIKDILTKRIALHPEDYYATEKCWEQEIKVLSRDLKETIDFISNRCTGEEFAWLSEVFEELQEAMKSEELCRCLYKVAQKYPKETEEYNILEFIHPVDVIE